MDPLASLRALAETWKDEADLLRRRGAPRQADALESAAEELDGRLDAWKLEAVTLEEASEIGGYSYSHLQHLVADGEIENVGEKGAPRIRRSEVPVKPGHGNGGPASKGDLLDRSLELHRERS